MRWAAALRMRLAHLRRRLPPPLSLLLLLLGAAFGASARPALAGFERLLFGLGPAPARAVPNLRVSLPPWAAVVADQGASRWGESLPGPGSGSGSSGSSSSSLAAVRPRASPRRSAVEDVAAYFRADRSQHGEASHYFVRYLKQRPTYGGTFLELGALDGWAFSNTYALEEAFGWRGVLVEAGPVNFEGLLSRRPGQVLVQAAVCSRPQLVHFAESHCCGGVVEFMPEAYRRYWHPRVNVSDPLSLAAVPSVPCLPLSRILNLVGVLKFDLFTLDVEGGELEVLRSLDWSTFRASVIAVEAATGESGSDERKNEEARRLLVSKGYAFDGRVGRNNWFSFNA